MHKDALEVFAFLLELHISGIPLLILYNYTTISIAFSISTFNNIEAIYATPLCIFTTKYN